jgi:hypothetical protein
MALTITEFAKKHRLRVKLDADDMTIIIAGATGQIYEYGSGLLAVMFILPHSREPSPRAWNHACRKCLAAGMTLRQNGDAEGALSFDPDNDAQARLAIRVAGVRRRKRPSEKQLANLVRGIKFSSTGTTIAGGFSG